MYPPMMQVPPPPPPMIIPQGKSGSPLLVLFLFCIVISVAGGVLAYFFIFKCKDENQECTTTSDCCGDLECTDSKCKKATTTVTGVSKCGEWDDLSNTSCWPEGYSVPSGFRNRTGNTVEECCRGSCREWFSDGNTCVSKIPMPGETLGYSEEECCEEGMWYRGEAGKSCNEVCNTLTTATKYCHPDNDITSEERLKQVMSSINFNSSQCGEFIETQYPMCENLSTVDWSDDTDPSYQENEPARLSYNTTTTECKYINPNILTLDQVDKESKRTGSVGEDYLPRADAWDTAYCSLELPDESLFCNCRDTKPIIGEGLNRSEGRSVSPWYGTKYGGLRSPEGPGLTPEEAKLHSRVNDGYLHGYEANYLRENGILNRNAFNDNVGIFLPLISSAHDERNTVSLLKAERTYESIENECAEGSIMAINTANPGYRCEAITTCTEWFGEEINDLDGCPNELPTPSPGATLGRSVTECCGP